MVNQTRLIATVDEPLLQPLPERYRWQFVDTSADGVSLYHPLEQFSANRLQFAEYHLVSGMICMPCKIRYLLLSLD